MTANPALTPLLTMEIAVEQLHSIAGTPSGDRQIFGVRGGHFEGARLRGQVSAWGGDCVTRTANGSLLDVRLLLETDDGVPLHLRYEGRAGQRDGAARIEIGGRFDAPAGRYGWLNDILVFGLGAQIGGGVRYELFHFA
ncbi:MAG TPA: DUF3237 domain-containing protein [Solimonas sp.]|nr:DUF3237 domain-containing protein [Solimonas sp.]